MKTRVVKVSKGYVPQLSKSTGWFSPEEWYGVSHTNFYLWKKGEDQLRYCLVQTEKEAEEVITRYNSYTKDITLLF